jgi:hypothetical protein
MLTQDQIQTLKAPCPPEALSSDTSRGFELTNTKALFVIERLNEVFGPGSIGWCYAHSPFEELHADSRRSGSPPPGVNPARLQAAPQFPPGNSLCHPDQMD